MGADSELLVSRAFSHQPGGVWTPAVGALGFLPIFNKVCCHAKDAKVDATLDYSIFEPKCPLVSEDHV